MKTVIAILNHSLPLAAAFDLFISNPPYSPLVIASVGLGPHGIPAISVWQYRHRGTKMLREPEMRFEVEWSGNEIAELYAYAWSSEYAELDEQAITCDGIEPDGKRIVRVDARMVADHRDYALRWDGILASQGFERAYYQAALLNPPFRNAHA